MRLTWSEPVPALPFDYPVVAKLCSADVPHKTEIGGVLLHVQGPEALAAARDELQQRLRQRAPHARCDEILVQAQCKGLAEVLLGYRIDPQAGPMVMLAAGGIWAEVLRDRSIRLAPVSREQAQAMITEVRALKVLQGLRGQTPGDLEALAEAIVALSQLALHPELGVTEAEINPLLVMPQGQGVQAVDALVRVGD